MDIQNLINFRANADTAKHDKIDIIIGNWYISTVDTYISAFIQLLVNRNVGIFHNHQVMVQVGSYTTVDILSQNLIQSPIAPLISGSLKIYGQGSRYKLQLHLSINPTRYCCYQPTPIRNQRVNGIPALHPPILIRPVKTNRTDEEYSLDGNDNVSLTTPAKINCRRVIYGAHLSNYLNSIESLVDSTLSQINPGDGFIVERDIYYSLQRIEVYWEISAQSPYDLLNNIEKIIASISNEGESRTFARRADVEQSFESKALSFEARSHQRVKIYTKTNKRIRIEVSSDFKRNPALRGGTYTFQSRTSLLDAMHMTCFENAISVNNVIAEISPRLQQHSRHRSDLLYLITSLYKAIGDIQQAEEILRALSTTNGIPRRGQCREKLMLLNRLVNQGLLAYIPNPFCRFTVHPRFAHLSTALSREYFTEQN